MMIIPKQSHYLKTLSSFNKTFNRARFRSDKEPIFRSKLATPKNNKKDEDYENQYYLQSNVVNLTREL